MRLGIILVTSLFALFAHAASHKVLSHKRQTPEELKNALAINSHYIKEATKNGRRFGNTPGMPVLETDKFQYLLLNGDDLGEDQIKDMHRIMSQNLPVDMILVVVTETKDAADVKRNFLSWVPQDRLIVASGDNLGDLVWGRDSYPYPVYMNATKQVELVAHQYFRDFSAQKVIASSVKATNVSAQNFVYVGGNLTATAKGDCFAVDSERIFGLPDATFKDVFRCKTITRLPFLVGIGDVDEVIKVLPNNIILTNQEGYRKTLEGMGYTVNILPEISGTLRTYANSVILNDMVFMPSYGDAKDSIAAKVYSDFGYRVISIPSDFLSDEMAGSLHCLTMTYPKMNLKALLQSLNLHQVK